MKKPAVKRGKMAKVMGEYKAGKLRSGSKTGPKVKDKKQAIAIGLKESGQSKTPRTTDTERSKREKRLSKVTF